ncbi:response regulator [Spirosoma sp. KUDC1026]|uniref:response regulator n=1 Tax=Spirosoma sp. KUDC1026 TaxID=2745947 RepID=UPI00159B85A3|nr:response regulator [Spirosoma sp. KUDC1026]QKZ14897.1 response regulator [Spirosoma sp. KUDC1026]
MKQKATIWLVDDDQNVVDVIQRAFQRENLSCQVMSFPDGSSLMQQLSHSDHLPSLLVVDYYLPGDDGLKIIEALKANPDTSTLKTVLFSQSLNNEIVSKAQDMNVYQVTPKPTSFKEWRDFADELCLAGYFV